MKKYCAFVCILALTLASIGTICNSYMNYIKPSFSIIGPINNNNFFGKQARLYSDFLKKKSFSIQDPKKLCNSKKNKFRFGRSTLYFQSDTLNNDAYFDEYIKILLKIKKHSQNKVCVVINDVNFLKINQLVNIYNDCSNLVIVPSEKIENLLKVKGLNVPLIRIENSELTHQFYSHVDKDIFTFTLLASNNDSQHIFDIVKAFHETFPLNGSANLRVNIQGDNQVDLEKVYDYVNCHNINNILITECYLNQKVLGSIIQYSDCLIVFKREDSLSDYYFDLVFDRFPKIVFHSNNQYESINNKLQLTNIKDLPQALVNAHSKRKVNLGFFEKNAFLNEKEYFDQKNQKNMISYVIDLLSYLN